MFLVTVFKTRLSFILIIDVRPVAAAKPVEIAVSPRPGGHIDIIFGDYHPLNNLYIDGASDYEAIYSNWFRQAPRQLTNSIRSRDIPEHVRELVLRREPCDPDMDYECLDTQLFDEMYRTGSQVLY